MLVMLIANLIILPVAISFFNDDLSTHWIMFNCVSDTVFLVDIAVNFRTGKQWQRGAGLPPKSGKSLQQTFINSLCQHGS